MNCKVYILSSDYTNKVYIGSTNCQYLSLRLAQHRYYYRKVKSGKTETKYTSFDIFDECPSDYDVDINLLEECSKEDKNTLEMNWINHYDADEDVEVVNKNNAIFDKGVVKAKYQESYKNNREYFINKSKAYYWANLEKCKKRANEYYYKNKAKNPK